MSSPDTGSMERQLRRQSIWLRDSLQWILEEKVLTGDGPETALDVGCGPGYVMDTMADMVRVSGVDLDGDMVRSCRARGLDVGRGSAYDLPFDDGSFDIVYCTFLMLWLDDPGSALQEMSRVSRKHVLCLAEPDFGARIDHPGELGTVREIVISGIMENGGDPEMGRKLRGLFQRCGLFVDVGIHPGVWSLERLGLEFEDEWSFVRSTCPEGRQEELAGLKKSWERALAEGTLFQFNPIFYALGSRAR